MSIRLLTEQRGRFGRTLGWEVDGASDLSAIDAPAYLHRAIVLDEDAEYFSRDDGATWTAFAGGGGGSTPVNGYHKVSAGSTNTVSIVVGSGTLFGVHTLSVAAYPVYVKFYDKASAPDPSSDTPIRTVGAQAGERADDEVGSGKGLSFTLGLAMAIVKGIADNDNTAVLASDVVVDVDYT